MCRVGWGRPACLGPCLVFVCAVECLCLGTSRTVLRWAQYQLYLQITGSWGSQLALKCSEGWAGSGLRPPLGVQSGEGTVPWASTLEEGCCKALEEPGALGWEEQRAVVQKGEQLFKGL